MYFWPSDFASGLTKKEKKYTEYDEQGERKQSPSALKLKSLADKDRAVEVRNRSQKIIDCAKLPATLSTQFLRRSGALLLRHTLAALLRSFGFFLER